MSKPFWEPEVGRRYKLLRDDGFVRAGTFLEVVDVIENGVTICYNETTGMLSRHGIKAWSVKGSPSNPAHPFFEHIPG